MFLISDDSCSGSSGLLKYQLIEGALIKVTPTLFMFKINKWIQIAVALDKMEHIFFYPWQELVSMKNSVLMT